jgi:hypothetical protein
MPYLVRALTTSTHPTQPGEVPPLNNWTAGKIQEVHDSLIGWYQDHTDAYTVLSQNGATPTGLPVISGLTAVDNCLDGVIHQTVFTLADVTQTLPNSGQYVGTKLYDFPAGRISVLGVTASLAEKTTSAIASTLNASKTGALALGTATASSTTLDSTMADLLPSTAWTSSATINVAGSAVTGALASAAQFDGTATAIDMYLNAAVATDGDLDADATIAWSGTITVTWINLGDY